MKTRRGRSPSDWWSRHEHLQLTQQSPDSSHWGLPIGSSVNDQPHVIFTTYSYPRFPSNSEYAMQTLSYWHGPQINTKERDPFKKNKGYSEKIKDRQLEKHSALLKITVFTPIPLRLSRESSNILRRQEDVPRWQDFLVAYNPRRHQGMTLRRRRSRHPRASSPLDRRRRRMPTFTTLSEDFISPPQTSSGSRARGFIVLPFPLFRTFVARTCLSGPLHIFLSLF